MFAQGLAAAVINKIRFRIARRARRAGPDGGFVGVGVCVCIPARSRKFAGSSKMDVGCTRDCVGSGRINYSKMKWGGESRNARSVRCFRIKSKSITNLGDREISRDYDSCGIDHV